MNLPNPVVHENNLTRFAFEYQLPILEALLKIPIQAPNM